MILESFIIRSLNKTYPNPSKSFEFVLKLPLTNNAIPSGGLTKWHSSVINIAGGHSQREDLC